MLPRNPLHAETYTIKKLNTPTIRINGTDMKVGDKFTDGAVVQWSSGTQAMRVLSDKNDVLDLRAGGATKPARMRTIVAGQSRLSSRAACTSAADHRQAFEGENASGHELLDTITITSGWRLDDSSFFEASIPTRSGKRVVRLPHNDNGQVFITRSLFPADTAMSDKEQTFTIEIRYFNGRKNEYRPITSGAAIKILPAFID